MQVTLIRVKNAGENAAPDVPIYCTNNFQLFLLAKRAENLNDKTMWSIYFGLTLLQQGILTTNCPKLVPVFRIWIFWLNKAIIFSGKIILGLWLTMNWKTKKHGRIHKTGHVSWSCQTHITSKTTWCVLAECFVEATWNCWSTGLIASRTKQKVMLHLKKHAVLTLPHDHIHEYYQAASWQVLYQLLTLALTSWSNWACIIW